MYFTSRDGVKINYVDQGEGRPLVFIHGLGGSISSYFYQLEYFKDKNRVVAYSLRGHGRSGLASDYSLGALARDLKDLIGQLDLNKPIIIAWSLGVHIVLKYLDLYGEEEIGGLVLIDMVLKFVNDQDYGFGFKKGQYFIKDAKEDLDLIEKDYRGYLEKFLNFSLNGKEGSGLLQEMARTNKEAFYCMYRELCQADFTGISIGLPSLLIFGGKSNFFKYESFYRLRENFSNLKISNVLNGSHFLVFEYGDLVNTKLEDFFKSLD